MQLNIIHVNHPYSAPFLCKVLSQLLSRYFESIIGFIHHSYNLFALSSFQISKGFNECNLKLAGMFLSKIIAMCIIAFARAIELTFELSDNANQCFFEDIKAGVDCVIEYQVLFAVTDQSDVVYIRTEIISGCRGISVFLPLITVKIFSIA